MTTRVTVLTGRRMTDLALPSEVPIETYVDETVSVLGELLEDAPADIMAGFDFTAQGEWTFARPGAPPMRAQESLDDAGVVDGALITLVAVSRTEPYRPLVEDVIDAIAVLDESPEFDRDALNRFIGLAIPIAATAVAMLAVLTWWSDGHSWWWTTVLGLLAVCLLTGSVLASKRHHDQSLGESLLVSAVAPSAGAIALAVPLPVGTGGTGGLGAPNLAGAAAVVSLLVVATRGGPRKRAVAASFLTVVTLAVAAAAVAYGYGWQAWVPLCAIASGLVVVTNAAKLTVAVARIALPPIPAPGESITNDELLEPVSTNEGSDDVSPTWQAIIASAPRSAVRLTERSQLAKQLLLGFLAAGTSILAVGAIAVVKQGHFLVHGLLVAALLTTLCGFRSRLYAERCCVWVLLAATVAIPTGVTIRLCLWYPDDAWLILGGYVAIAVISVVAIGATASIRRVSPVTKRILELVDGAAVAAVIPLLLWIAGVYDALRNVRF